MKKRILSLMLVIVMIFAIIPAMSIAEEQSKPTQYTVLVLDTSGDSVFLDEALEPFYTSKTEVNSVKKAATKFIENILYPNPTDKIAIVEFKNVANVVSPFTNDIENLKTRINCLTAYSETRNIAAGLDKAYELVNSIEDTDAEVNVVIFSTGYTNNGDYNYSGYYNADVIAGNWQRIDTGIKFFAYSNVAIEAAEKLKKIADIYSIGFFHNIDNIPEYGKDVPEFFKLVAKDLATSDDYFYEVNDADDIETAFDILADEVQNGFEIYADIPNLTVVEGEEVKVAVKYKENDIAQRLSFGISSSIENKDMADITDAYVTANDELLLTIKAKQPGSTTLKISDAEKGYMTTASIRVIPRHNNTYTIYSVPCEDITVPGVIDKNIVIENSSFYNFNGLYIDEYKKKVNSDGSCDLNFDVYNQNYSYGIVEVYNSDDEMIDVVLLDKFADANTSIKETMWDGVGRLIDLGIQGGTYKTKLITQKTSVEIKNIPAGGYIKITVDAIESPILGVVNQVNIIMNGASAAKEIVGSGKENHFELYEEFTHALFEASKLSTSTTFFNELKKNMIENVRTQAFSSSTDAADFAKSSMELLNGLDWESMLGKAAVKTGVATTEDIFKYLSGPAKVGFDLCFGIGKAANTYNTMLDHEFLKNTSSICIQVPQSNSRNYGKVCVQSSVPIDKNISLETYKIEIKELSFLPESVRKHLEAQEYVDYINISMIKDGKETQIDGNAVVTIPITNEMRKCKGDFRVYRVETDGTLTPLKTRLSSEKDYIEFETDHFSIYAIVAETNQTPDTNKQPTTFDNAFLRVSDWAKAEVEEAYSLGLIPDCLIGSDLTERIDREDFAAIAVTLYEKVTGKTYSGKTSPFTDIGTSKNKEKIEAAYDLNIIAGTSNTTFSPYDLINREQMATMMTRVFKKYSWSDWNLANDSQYHLNTTISGPNFTYCYTDDSSISAFARPSVYFLDKHNVIAGVGYLQYAPSASATKDQAIAIALRSYKNLFKDSVTDYALMSDIDYKQMYLDYINANPYDFDATSGMALIDINNDTVPELFTFSCTSRFGTGEYIESSLSEMFVIRSGNAWLDTPWLISESDSGKTYYATTFHDFPNGEHFLDSDVFSVMKDKNTGEYALCITSNNDASTIFKISNDLHSGTGFVKDTYIPSQYEKVDTPIVKRRYTNAGSKNLSKAELITVLCDEYAEAVKN